MGNTNFCDRHSHFILSYKCVCVGWGGTSKFSNPFEDLFFIRPACVSVYACVHMSVQGLQRPEENVGSHGARVTVSCVSPNMSAGN